MEYESRQLKWYWLIVFILFCAGTAYLLFLGNPYLYSHVELRGSLLNVDLKEKATIPTHPKIVEKLGPQTSITRYNWERTAVEPNPTARSRVYEEYEHHTIDLGLEGFEPQNVASDATGFYLSGKSPWVVAIGLDGVIRWKYRFLDIGSDKGLWPILLDESSAYLIPPTGELVSLDKSTGQLRWVMDLNQEVVAAPFIWQKNIVVPVKNKSGVQLLMVHRTDGRVDPVTPRLEIKPGFQLSFNPELGEFIATLDNKVIGIDPEEWEIDWTQTLTDPIRGPAVLVDNAIYVATLSGKIVKLDASKKGKIDWEVDLEKPAISPPTVLPIMGKLAVLDSADGLSTIDMKTGKVGWRLNTENRNPLNEIWASRLKGSNIEEFKMDWLHKGWTIWSPCSDKRFCIYTPTKGQLIQKVTITGAPLALPVLLERRLVFLTQLRNGKLGVSNFLEEADIKKLKAAKENSEKSSQ